ncbi:MAG TPA: acetamidase/formamidase family protein [Pseudolysinimonas sp.]|jgi:acetamidase/formamidase
MHRLEATSETLTVGYFDPTAPAVLEVDSGEVVDIETVTHWGGRVTPESTLDDLLGLWEEFPGVGPHSLTGPIGVRGAMPGHVLRVDIEELTLAEHGFNVSYSGTRGAGLLADDIAEGGIRHFDLDLETMTTTLGDTVTIGLEPFLGIMGVAPPGRDRVSTIPPGVFGGNMDLRALVAGTTLYLPVWQPGAGFSIGDAHARQGNGEVCLTAIESAIPSARLRLTVVDDLSLEVPMAETATHWITMGMDADLLVAARQATLNMVRFLQRRFGLPERDAYGLCSIAGDLEVTQVVNSVKGAHMTMAKSLFI